VQRLAVLADVARMSAPGERGEQAGEQPQLALGVRGVEMRLVPGPLRGGSFRTAPHFLRSSLASPGCGRDRSRGAVTFPSALNSERVAAQLPRLSI
jgi:hypothetical protein